MTTPTTPTTPATPTTPTTPARRTTSHPFAVPAASHAYLARAAASLREAMVTSEVPLRYAQAHVAALRATAALLAARATPVTARPGSRRRPAQKTAWVLLAEVAPELAEWAAFFSAGAAKRAAAEAGSTRAVTEREADDLVRDADRFLGLVEESLGLPRHAPHEAVLLGCDGRSTGKAEERRRDQAKPTPSDENAAGGRPGRSSRVA
jgi:SAV_6107-like HEPN